MRYKVQVGSREHEVEVREDADGLSVRVDGGEPQRAALSGAAPLHTLSLGTRRLPISIEPDAEEPGRLRVALPGEAPLAVEPVDARFANLLRKSGAGERRLRRLKSPMPGVIVDTRVAVGDVVSKGQVLLVLEAMKMQNEIRAAGEGRVKQVAVSVGQAVPAGALLMDFE